MIYCESPLERDLACLLELDPDVLAFQEQPVRLEYVLDGTPHWHVPDFAIRRSASRELVEVKPSRKAADPVIAARTAALVHSLAPEGIRYLVLDEASIRAQPRLKNIKLLLRYRGTDLPESAREAAIDAVHREGLTLSIDELARLVPKLGRTGVYALIGQGVLLTDLSVPLGEAGIGLAGILR
jgi:hypothetical protein